MILKLAYSAALVEEPGRVSDGPFSPDDDVLAAPPLRLELSKLPAFSRREPRWLERERAEALEELVAPG